MATMANMLRSRAWFSGRERQQEQEIIAGRRNGILTEAFS